MAWLRPRSRLSKRGNRQPHDRVRSRTTQVLILRKLRYALILSKFHYPLLLGTALICRSLIGSQSERAIAGLVVYNTIREENICCIH